MPTFGERLKELREAAGLSQAQLVARTGRGLATVKAYEADRRSPSLDNAQRLAAALGVPVTAFDGVAFRHATQRPPARDLPAAPAPRRTGRKMPGKPGRRKGTERPP